jgi:hypothetical protein
VRARLALGLAALLIAALARDAQPAAAAPARPIDLHVVGGDGWHADNSFDLQWTNPAAGSTPLAAVHYRIRNPLGAQVVAARLGRVTDGVTALSVPSVPGAYSAEVWLEDAAGAEGTAATVALRFDDRRPAAIAAPQIHGWIGRTTFPLAIRLGHPPGTPPASGIRGYAVAIDSTPGGPPCAGPDRCSASETTLAGGVGDDTLATAGLPEGTSHLHAVAVSGAGMRSATTAHATLRVDTTDPLTSLAGAPAGWSSHPVTLTASATDARSGMEPDGFGPPPMTAIRIDGDAAVTAPGASVAVTVIEEGAHTIAFFARDAAGNANDGGNSNGIAHRPPSTALLRIDRTPPSVAFANAQDPGDPELIRAGVADSLSGRDLSLGWIGVRAAGSGDPFQPLPPAPAEGGELRARWSSDAYPVGEYEFRAVGYDVAGNAAATTQRANGTAMQLSNPLKLTTALRAGFGGATMTWHRCARRRGGSRHCRRETIAAFERRPTSRTVPYGRGALLSGLLLCAAGAAPAGAPVRIVERFAGGQAARVSTVSIGPDGSFSLHLAPGPSREVAASFAGNAALSASAGTPLRLRVRSRVRLRTSSAAAKVGGAPLVFRGRVSAPPGAIPPDGISVQLQFRLPSLPWSEFRTVQTDGNGNFGYAYRFSDDDSRGVRFQFRAHAPAQDGWPYEPGSSRPVAVRGR